VSLESAVLKKLGQGAPEWLCRRREHAWNVYKNTPLPTTQSEEWRYTDLSQIVDLESLKFLLPGDVDLNGSLPEILEGVLNENRTASGSSFLVDGLTTNIDSEAGLSAQGVIFTSLRSAVEDYSDLLEEHLAVEALPPEKGKFEALNAAFWTDGVLLYVPRGVNIKLPFRTVNYLSHAGSAVCTRTLIIAEAGSQVSYVEEIISEDFDEITLASSSLEVIAKEGAQVQFVSIQQSGHGVFCQSAQRTLAHRDSILNTLNVGLGGSVSRVDLNSQLLGSGAKSDMLGIYFGDQDQCFDHNTSQDHVASNSGSDLLYKGALDGSSRAAFRGIIRVHPGAQGTDAYQTNRNLLLSDNARADSLPNLEIEADDVKCSHGATIGQLDKEALFYLLSRGLSRQQAERLVVLGFLGDVMSRLPLGDVVDEVTQAIEQKLLTHA